MAKVLVSYQFDIDNEVNEDLWVYRKFPGVWNGKTTFGQTVIYTLALEPEDALYVGMCKKTCPVPGIWKNALTTGGVS